MNAAELERWATGEFGKLRTDISNLRGDIREGVAVLKAEDRDLGTRVTATDAKVATVDDLAGECDKRIDEIVTRLSLLEQAFARDKVDREKWYGRAWQLIGIAFGCVLTAIAAVILTAGGIKRP